MLNILFPTKRVLEFKLMIISIIVIITYCDPGSLLMIVMATLRESLIITILYLTIIIKLVTLIKCSIILTIDVKPGPLVREPKWAVCSYTSLSSF